MIQTSLETTQIKLKIQSQSHPEKLENKSGLVKDIKNNGIIGKENEIKSKNDLIKMYKQYSDTIWLTGC